MSTTIYGIDVSKYQGEIDWTKVKAAGKEFAFIRLGTCGTDGRIQANGRLDPYFRQNIQGAAAAGVKAGVYLYSYAATADAAKVAAQEVLELVKGYTLEYPIAFDLEDSSYTTNTKAFNAALADSFLSTVEAAGYYAMLYTYKSFAENNVDMGILSQYDVWIAQYASQNTYKGNYGIWQYSSTGTVDGISGAVDLNVSYQDYAAIIKQAGLNGFPKADEDGSNETPPEEGSTGENTSGEGDSGQNSSGDTQSQLIELLKRLIQAIKDLLS